MSSQWGYRLAFVLHTIYRIADNGFPVVNIQPALIVAIVSVPRHSDVHVTKGLERHTHVLSDSIGHNICVGQILRLLIFAFKD